MINADGWWTRMQEQLFVPLSAENESTTAWSPGSGAANEAVILIPPYARRMGGLRLPSDSDNNDAMTDTLEALRAEMRLEREAARADRAEARADFDRLRADMASFETRLVERAGTVESAVSGMQGQAAGLRDSIDGLKTATTALQWMVGVLLAVAALWVALEQWKSPAQSAVPSSAAAQSSPPPIIFQPQIFLPGAVSPASAPK